MLNSRRGVRIIGLTVGFVFAASFLWAAKQPSPGPARALQRLAEKQGHSGAAAQNLRNFGHQVPKEIEAAAASVKPEALRRATEQNGPLAARLETARGKRLSAEQSQRLAAAEREHVRQLQSLRAKFTQDVAGATGLPQAKIQKPLARDQGDPAAEIQVLTQIEKSLGRRLTAGQANRVTSARGELFAASQSQRNAFARQAGKIAGVPQSVVLELMR
jgi:hypothetical protein